ncbi:unnamed protein product [Anisakis simplex]|uniref:Protein kinase domain-containing protein n=1 Tax=Anisakis simplex TaxID=6269 RepID=A0A0M3JVN6_ANISI|nr:unnamed protein product [Anisakis simplex]
MLFSPSTRTQTPFALSTTPSHVVIRALGHTHSVTLTSASGLGLGLVLGLGLSAQCTNMQINTEDITVPWGRSPDPQDIQNGRWRMAVFQDVQESNDKSKLFFLYDPVADESSGTSGGRKGAQGIVVFDTNLRCFITDVPVNVLGTPKFLFALKCPSPQGGTSLVMVTESANYGQAALMLYRIDMRQDGMNLETQPIALLASSIPISGDFIISMREDAPEVVVLTSPGLTVWRINCLVTQPSSPTSTYAVPNADLNHFYDAYLSQGNIYLLSASPDGQLDYSRIHVLSITGQSEIRTQVCGGDPQRGTPCARRQAALDSISGFILLAGGEIDYGDSVTRLVDYWMLNLSTFTWMQIPAQMPIPLIEPRLTATNSGNVYLWGDFDQPLPGMPAEGTHLRILKMTGFQSANPPPYCEALKQPSTAPYPSGDFSSSAPLTAPYPTNTGSGSIYPNPNIGQQQQNISAYPQPQPYSGGAGAAQSGPMAYQQPYQVPYGGQPNNPGFVPPQSSYPNPIAQQGSYPQAPQQPAASTEQYAYYPPPEKKSCTIQ